MRRPLADPELRERIARPRGARARERLGWDVIEQTLEVYRAAAAAPHRRPVNAVF
jgi:hypothetical protein